MPASRNNLSVIGATRSLPDEALVLGVGVTQGVIRGRGHCSGGILPCFDLISLYPSNENKISHGYRERASNAILERTALRRQKLKNGIPSKIIASPAEERPGRAHHRLKVIAKAAPAKTNGVHG
jgi:hypothetical protein